MIDAIILVGVAMHSHIWSIKYKGRRIKFNLKWVQMLIACISTVVVIFGLYFFAINNFDSAFVTVRYVGIVLSSFFVFLCFNEVFYLIRRLRA